MIPLDAAELDETDEPAMMPIRPREPKRYVETDLTRDIRLAINRTDFARVWRNNVAKRKPGCPRCGCDQCVQDQKRMLHSGLAKGSADLIGIVLRPSGAGIFVSIEVKMPGREHAHTDTLADQIAWMKAIQHFGGCAVVVTSVDQALAFVAQARGE